MKRKGKDLKKPPTKKQKINNKNNKNGKQIKPYLVVKQKINTNYTLNEMKILIQVWKYYKSKNIINKTLDRIIYECYVQLFKEYNKNNNNKISKAINDQRIKCIVFPSRIYFSNTYFSQLRQLKAQLFGYRYLSRDLPLSNRLNELINGKDNIRAFKENYYCDVNINNNNKHRYNHSIIKPYIVDRTPNKDNILFKNNNNNKIIIDDTPETIEELVYQDEYNLMAKIMDRRTILNEYLNKYKAYDTKKLHFFDKKAITFAKHELNELNYFEIQQNMRHKIVNNDLHHNIYNNFDCENEVLIDPDLMKRKNKIGLQFDSHINLVNRPNEHVIAQHKYLATYYIGQK